MGRMEVQLTTSPNDMRTGKILAFIFSAALLIAAPSFQAKAQNVSSAEFRQDGDKVIVTFLLDRQADISLYVSTDGGSTFKGPLEKVSGDVGETVASGKCSIVWDPIAEFGGISGNDICFKVKALPVRELASAGTSRSKAGKEPFTRFGIGAGIGTMQAGSESMLTYHIPVELLFGRNSQRLNFSLGETFSFFKNTAQFTTAATLKANFAGMFYIGAGGGFNINVYTDEDGFLEDLEPDLPDLDDYFDDDFDDMDGAGAMGSISPLPKFTGAVHAEAGIRISGFDLSVFYKYDFYRISGLSTPGTFGGVFKYYF